MRWGTREWFLNKFDTQGTNEPGAYYAHSASGYQRYRHARIVRQLQRHAGDRLRGRLLDIGCGTGDLTARLADTFAFDAVTGVDFLEPAIEHARQRYLRIRFQAGELPRIAFPDDTFDVVLASEVLYYLSPEDRQAAVREIARVLRKGGIFIFTSALGQGYFATADAERLVRQEGFRADHVWHDYNRLYHAVSAPALFVNNVYYALYSGTRVSSQKTSARIERFGRFFDNTAARFLLSVARWLCRPLIAGERLPRWLASGSERLFPRWARTNVNIVATRL